MEITLKEKKTEAIAQMKAWGIDPEIIHDFQQTDLVSVCEAAGDTFCRADGSDLQRIRFVERMFGVLVYLVVRSETSLGKQDVYLYVSSSLNDWEMQHSDRKKGMQICYVYNYDEPDFSEIGSVGLRPTPQGGLVRTW